MELRVLRYFLTIVQEQNISKAAKKLNISQPSISRQIKELEEELEVTLFIRGNRKIELTSTGEYFANQAKQILSLANKTISNIHQSSDITGTVTIGSAESPAIELIAQSIKNLNNKYPNIQVNIVSTNADEVKSRMSSNLFDFGIIMDTYDKSSYDFINLPGKSRFGILITKDSPLANKKVITPADLRGQKLILSQQSGAFEMMQDMMGNSSKDYSIVATYNLLYNASLLAKAHVGIVICLDGIINTADSNLIFIPFAEDLTAKTSFVWAKNMSLSNAATALLQEVKDLTNKK